MADEVEKQSQTVSSVVAMAGAIVVALQEEGVMAERKALICI